MSKPSLKETAYRSILEWIGSDQMQQGSVTSETALAARLDMSRTPVREALQQLAAEGFIRIVPKHGVQILPPSAGRISDLLEEWTAYVMFAYEHNKRSHPTEIANAASKLRDCIAATAEEPPELLVALEKEMWTQWLAQGRNNELMHRFQITLAKIRWDCHGRRWKAPHRTETEQCMADLTAAIIACSDNANSQFFAYLHILKKTWY
ncbi:MAG: GntR family transcriptional regulator [Paenibacillaceae bacterium]|nr:GntR family transcriptional regulator [Paenibacillaceae bacterium]